jgi:hypothetical protein
MQMHEKPRNPSISGNFWDTERSTTAESRNRAFFNAGIPHLAARPRADVGKSRQLLRDIRRE